MGVAENIESLMYRYDINQEALARIVGVSQAAVSKWTNGGNPSNASLKILCKHFGLEPSDILSDEHGLARQPINRLTNRRPMTHGRATYLPVRRLGMVHAGDPTDEPEADAVAMVPEDVALAHPDGFVLRVEGDCMDRLIPDGYDVVVDPTVEPRVGSVVVARSEDTQEVVMRRLAGTARTRVLEACSHGDYEDLVFPQDGGPVSVVGVVVWSQRGFLD